MHERSHARVCVCFVTVAVFVYLGVCVCVCADVPWVMRCRESLSVLRLVSWFHQSVVIPPDIRSIKLILKEQKQQGLLFGLLFVQTVCVCERLCACKTVTVHEAHTCVSMWTWMCHVYLFMCVYIQLRVCVCALRCHQYTQGQVHSMLRDSKSREGAYKWPPELTTVMNYGRALSQDTTPTSKNMTAACEAKCNRHISQWKLK